MGQVGAWIPMGRGTFAGIIFWHAQTCPWSISSTLFARGTGNAASGYQNCSSLLYYDYTGGTLWAPVIVKAFLYKTFLLIILSCPLGITAVLPSNTNTPGTTCVIDILNCEEQWNDVIENIYAFSSSKFSAKVQYVNSLAQLTQVVPTEYIFIPDEVLQ